MIAFGPVPSRRLGRSLGVNNIPDKVCSFACVYCQIGRTLRMELERRPFYEPELIFAEVKKKVKEARARGEEIDYITFVPDGEPTLDINLGREIDLLRGLGIPLAILTNSSLLWREDVREDLLKFDFGKHHPFKIERLGLTFGLMEAYGLTDKEGVSLIAPREATEEEAGSFHTKDYLEILRLAGSGIWISNLSSYGLGTPDNPIFPEVYAWGMLVAGASIDAAKAILAGGRVAFNFAGGLHHAMPSRASGFCHINDPVLAIKTLRAAGKRVAYIDIDAHHGDGVQRAFYTDPNVLTISIHQSGYTIFPGTGFVDEIGEGEGKGYSVNIPLLPGAGDRAYARAFDRVVIPLIEAYAPEVLVTQLGADALIGDAVAGLRLTIHGYEGCVNRISRLDLPWLGLGGGGYDFGNVSRAWTLAWGIMLGEELPDRIPEEWLTAASMHGVAVTSLRGPEGEYTPESVLADLDRTIEAIRRDVFPIVAGGSGAEER